MFNSDFNADEIKKLNKTEKIEPIYSNKQQEKYNAPEPESLDYSFPLILGMFSFFFRSIAKDKEKFEEMTKENSVIFLLTSLKRLFVILSKDDLTEDSSFSQNLSHTWSGLKKLFENYSSKETSIDFYKKGILLLESMDCYPPGEEHSLAFYLKNHAGETWLPFPYILTLKKLRNEFLNNQESSHLNIWILSIDEMVDIFKKM